MTHVSLKETENKMFQKKTANHRQNKKSKSPGKQPICGLSAAARCANIIFKTASDVDKFRSLCLENNLVDKKKSWIGGTTAADRSRICKFFGLDTKEVDVSAILANKNLTLMQPGSKNETLISVKKLLNSAWWSGEGFSDSRYFEEPQEEVIEESRFTNVVVYKYKAIIAKKNVKCDMFLSKK